MDRKSSHTDLRTVQQQALKALNEVREDKDIILKMSTGSGKTTVALLFLLSHMNEKEEPVVYFMTVGPDENPLDI